MGLLYMVQTASIHLEKFSILTILIAFSELFTLHQHLQYMLSVLSAYIPEIPPLAIDGIFGSATRNAVIAAQRRFGLPETGIVNFDTWNEIYDQFSGIETTSWRNPENFPYTSAIINGTPPRTRYSQSTTLTQFPGNNLSAGNQDSVRQEAPR